MIIRVDKDEKEKIEIHKFPIIYDKELSFKAKGILTYLMGHDDKWECRSDDLVDHGTEGLSAIKSGIKELQQKGYLKKEHDRDEKTGRLNGWVWVIREIPSEEFQSHFCENKRKVSINPKVENKLSVGQKIKLKSVPPKVENNTLGETTAKREDSPKVENKLSVHRKSKNRQSENRPLRIKGRYNVDQTTTIAQKKEKPISCDVVDEGWFLNAVNSFVGMGFSGVTRRSLLSMLNGGKQERVAGKKGYTQEQIETAFQIVRSYANFDSYDNPVGEVWGVLRSGISLDDLAASSSPAQSQHRYGDCRKFHADDPPQKLSQDFMCTPDSPVFWDNLKEFIRKELVFVGGLMDEAALLEYNGTCRIGCSKSVFAVLSEYTDFIQSSITYLTGDTTPVKLEILT